MSVLKNSLPVLCAKRFTWTGKNKSRGVAEASDFKNEKITGRVYDDACDEGFVVRGKHESIVFCFAGCEEDFNGEDEVMAWTYVSINDRTGRPDNRFHISILND